MFADGFLLLIKTFIRAPPPPPITLRYVNIMSCKRSHKSKFPSTPLFEGRGELKYVTGSGSQRNQSTDSAAALACFLSRS